MSDATAMPPRARAKRSFDAKRSVEGTEEAPVSVEVAERPAHPRHATDAVLTAPIRLSIVAALSRVDEMEFAALRDLIELSDSALSKQVAALDEVGYVTVRKGYVGKRPRTWLRVSSDGRAALARHLAALTAIVEGT